MFSVSLSVHGGVRNDASPLSRAADWFLVSGRILPGVRDMRKTIRGGVSAIAIAVATGGGAWAADLPVKAAPYARAPLFDWSGWYFGANVARVNGKIIADSDPGWRIAHGVTPGLQLGYNIQNGNVVWGIEGDIALTRSKFNWSSIGD